MLMFQLLALSLFVVPLICGVFIPSYWRAFAVSAVWGAVAELIHPLSPTVLGSLVGGVGLAAVMTGIGYGIQRLRLRLKRGSQAPSAQ
jgi:hypothetical protein